MAAAFWLLLWHLAARRLALPLLLPSPAAVLCRLGELAVTGAFWQTIAYSLLRILAGFGLGLVCGCLLALLAFFCRPAEALCRVPLGIIKSTPVASFILLVILWAPTGQVPVVVSALMVLPVVWGNVGRGIRETDPKLLEQAGALRFSRLKTVRLVYLPSVRPYFLSAVVTSLGLAWKSGVAAEVLCRPAWAVGTQIVQARDYLETPSLFAWPLVVLLLSWTASPSPCLRRGSPPCPAPPAAARPPCCGFWPGWSTPSPAGSPACPSAPLPCSFRRTASSPGVPWSSTLPTCSPAPGGWRSPAGCGWQSWKGKSVPIPPICPAAWDGVWPWSARWPWVVPSICWTSPLQGWTLSGQTASYPPWGSWPPLSSWSAMSLPFWTGRTGSSDWTGRP